MRREDEQPRVGERAEQHQHVAVIALAADLLGVHARGLVAVVAVGDQELGPGQRVLERGDLLSAAHAPERVAGALVVRRGGERLASGRPLERRRGGAVLVGEEAEDGGQVRARGPGQPEAVLLGPGVGSLVRADPARARSPLRARARRGRSACAPSRPGPCTPGEAPTAPAPPRSRGRPARASRASWPRRARSGHRRPAAARGGRSRPRCAGCGRRARPAARRRSRRRGVRSRPRAGPRRRARSGCS